MKCLVKSDTLGYYGDKGQSAWVTNPVNAKVFRTKHLAEGVVKILSWNRIRDAHIRPWATSRKGTL